MQIDLKGNERILLMDFRRIGDTLMSLPILEAIKTTYPETHLSFLVEKKSASLMEHNPYIDHCFVFDETASLTEQLKLIRQLKRQQFDITIDTLGMPKSAILGYMLAKVRIGLQPKRKLFYTHLETTDSEFPYSACNKLKVTKPIGAFPETAMVPEIFIHKTETDHMKKVLGLDRFITSAPATRHDHKQLWQPSDWAYLYDQLITLYHLPIILSCAPSETNFIELIFAEVQQKDMLITNPPIDNIRDLAVLLNSSTFHISGDNGSKHIANAVKTPCLTLWNYMSPCESFLIPHEWQISFDVILWAGDYRSSSTNDHHQLTVEKVLKEVKSFNICL